LADRECAVCLVLDGRFVTSDVCLVFGERTQPHDIVEWTLRTRRGLFRELFENDELGGLAVFGEFVGERVIGKKAL
jgi:hypothetical protein